MKSSQCFEMNSYRKVSIALLFLMAVGVFMYYEEFVSLLSLKDFYGEKYCSAPTAAVKPGASNNTAPELQTPTKNLINHTSPPTAKKTSPPQPFDCFKPKTPPSKPLPDVLDQKTNKTIIAFQETFCRPHNASKLILNPRQACSIESAALNHPNHDIYVLIVAETEIGSTSDLNDRTVRQLLKYRNVKFLRINIDTYFKDTPVEALYRSGEIQKSDYAMIHLSDVLRFVTMWRFGAMYVDLDVIVLKNLDDLSPNFAGYQAPHDIASGILRFSKDEKGHKWAEMCLEALNNTFQAWSWSYNTNGILHGFLSKICKTNNANLWNKERCDGFEIYNPEVFYPVPYPIWHEFFDENALNATIKHLEVAKGAHFWNHLSKDRKVNVGTHKSAMEYIAQRFCPRVYSQLDNEF